MTRIHSDFLTWPATLAVFDALEAAGGADCVRYVGGCVRNALQARPVADIDLATRLTPEQVMAAAAAHNLKTVPTGAAHGTITVIARGVAFEVTTLRADVETDGRRAVVAFTHDWSLDAQRRDFRLNALYADRSGQVFDPTGEGIADALAGRVVFVGEARQRIREDYLRILRFYRFSAHYGGGGLDPSGQAACAELAVGLTRLSAERIAKELLKLLEADDPRIVLRAMDAAGLFKVLQLQAPDAAIRLCGLTPDPVLRLSLLLGDDAKSVRAAAARLKLSRAHIDRVSSAAAIRERLAGNPTAQGAKRLIYAFGPGPFHDGVLLALAEADEVEYQSLKLLLQIGESWTPPVFPLKGRDAAALGLAEGPRVGQLLKAVEADWVASDFPAADLHADLAARIKGEGL